MQTKRLIRTVLWKSRVRRATRSLVRAAAWLRRTFISLIPKRKKDVKVAAAAVAVPTPNPTPGNNPTRVELEALVPADRKTGSYCLRTSFCLDEGRVSAMVYFMDGKVRFDRPAIQVLEGALKDGTPVPVAPQLMWVTWKDRKAALGAFLKKNAPVTTATP